MTIIGLTDDREKGRSYNGLDTLFDLSRLGNPREKINTYAEVARPEQQNSARTLHAYMYLRKGYVKDEDIIDGVLSPTIDPNVDRSTYFIITNNGDGLHPVIVARQIAHDPERAFPLLEHMDIYPSAKKDLEDVDLSQCVEISGLAKMPGVLKYYTLLLYRDMWQHAVRQGHDKWFIASDERLTKSLEDMFGATITRLGGTQVYLGSPTDPMLLDSRNGLATLLKECLNEPDSKKRLDKKTLIAILIDGLDQSLLSQEQRDLINIAFEK